MRKRWVVLVAALLIVVPATVAAAQTTLTVEEALSENSDSDVVSYSFTVDTNNDTTITIPSFQTSQSAAGGDVNLEFERWEQAGTGRSGTGTSWGASDGETYRIVYEASTSTDVGGSDEGTYQFDVEPQDSDGTIYAETFSVTFEYLSPEFGSSNSPTGEIEFSGGSSAGTNVRAEFSNDGDGTMIPESVSYSGVPSAMAVSTRNLDDQVDASDQEQFDVSIDADESISEGTYTFTATVRDSLGNTVDIPIEVDVYKPPAISIDRGSNIDLGGILRGNSDSASIEISETTGYGPVNDLSVDVDERESDASISFFSLDGVSIGASRSTTGEVRVDVGGNAEQHQDLAWDVDFEPDNPRSNQQSATVSARVLYRPYFDGIGTEDARLVYDEPKDQTTAFRKELTVNVSNGGDLEMNVIDISTSASSGTRVEVVDGPSAIPPLSTETVDIAVVGDPDTDEGVYSYTVGVTGEEAEYRGSGAATTETSGKIEIVHETDVAVDPGTVEYGEIPITEERTRSFDIRERLGYKDVTDLRIEQVDGPESWLERIDEPDSLSAGERQSMIVGVTFDADATLYKEYTWQFRIDGGNVEAETVNITAIPRPVQCTKVVENLEEYDGSGEAEQMASNIATGVRNLEERLRENPEEGPIRDLSRACTASRSALLFLNANERSQSLIEEGNHSGAQTHVGRMAVGFDTMAEYVERIGTNGARRPMKNGADIAQSLLNERVESQVTHYEESLSEDNSSLQQAETYRELAQLAALQGDNQRAEDFGNRAEDAFEQYRTSISEGTAALQRARDTRDELEESLFVSAFGVRVFWIGNLDRFEAQTASVLSDYETAREQFEQAGATSRAQQAAEERAQMAGAYDSAFFASAVLGGAVGLIFVVVLVYEVLSVYRYIQDSRAAVSGEFLL